MDMSKIPKQNSEALEAVKKVYSEPVQRPCGDCTACCDTLRIPELDKPTGIACSYSCNGCEIYSERPNSCRSFRCAWSMGYGKPSDRPDRSGSIADYRDGHLGWKMYGLIFNQGSRAMRALNRISNDAGVDVFLVT